MLYIQWSTFVRISNWWLMVRGSWLMRHRSSLIALWFDRDFLWIPRSFGTKFHGDWSGVFGSVRCGFLQIRELNTWTLDFSICVSADTCEIAWFEVFVCSRGVSNDFHCRSMIFCFSVMPIKLFFSDLACFPVTWVLDINLRLEAITSAKIRLVPQNKTKHFGYVEQ